MEPLRRDALVKAAIHEIGVAGSLNVTVGQIARRAGVSSALAHHYFGAKEQIFLAAMRQILTDFGVLVIEHLKQARGPRARLEAIVRASFAPQHYPPEVVGAWLIFYARAQRSEETRQLLRIYRARLKSNLVHDLRPLVGSRAPRLADQLAAMIDGQYLRSAMSEDVVEGNEAAGLVLDSLDTMLEHFGRRHQ